MDNRMSHKIISDRLRMILQDKKASQADSPIIEKI